MVSRRMTVGFYPSASCIDASNSTDSEATSGGGGQSQTQYLLRTVDFYATVLAMASHDLRQPLQAIVSAHDLLARRLTTGPEREHLERGEQASNQLEETLDQLVEALQLQQHATRIDPEPVRIDPILQKIALQLTGPVRRKGIEYRTIRSRTVIMSQPLLLGGILRNLARNAVHHTPPGGVFSSAADGSKPAFALRSTTRARAFRRISCKASSSRFFDWMRRARRALGWGCSS